MKFSKDYEWNDILQAFIQILADSKREMDEYTIIAQVLYSTDFIESCDNCMFNSTISFPLVFIHIIPKKIFFVKVKKLIF